MDEYFKALKRWRRPYAMFKAHIVPLPEVPFVPRPVELQIIEAPQDSAVHLDLGSARLATGTVAACNYTILEHEETSLASFWT